MGVECVRGLSFGIEAAANGEDGAVDWERGAAEMQSCSGGDPGAGARVGGGVRGKRCWCGLMTNRRERKGVGPAGRGPVEG